MPGQEAEPEGTEGNGDLSVYYDAWWVSFGSLRTVSLSNGQAQATTSS